LAVFSELRRGVIPENFAAWVWQIARTCYSKWADKKHRKSDNILSSDIDDIEIVDGTSVESKLVYQEDLSLIRQELAFIASEYRQIIVAYYIEDKSIHDITESLRLPERTGKPWTLMDPKLNQNIFFCATITP
jgi:DNA-directed RNA polymerase specialized sigma24 family protein